MSTETFNENGGLKIDTISLPETNQKISDILSTEESEKLSKEINQNIVGIKTERIIAPEAQLNIQDKLEVLIEWKEGVNGGEFLKSIYEAGMSFQLLKKVLEYVKEEISNNPEQKIALNLHPTDFLHPDLENKLDELIKLGLRPENITLELLEENIENGTIYALILRVNQLKEKYSLTISMDDFDGTSEMYSRYLKLSQVIDTVKVDGPYFRKTLDIDTKSQEEQRESLENLQTFINQFHQDGKSVVIEWIRSEEHFEQAIKLGADLLQGYYFNGDN